MPTAGPPLADLNFQETYGLAPGTKPGLTNLPTVTYKEQEPTNAEEEASSSTDPTSRIGMSVPNQLRNLSHVMPSSESIVSFIFGPEKLLVISEAVKSSHANA